MNIYATLKSNLLTICEHECIQNTIFKYIYIYIIFFGGGGKLHGLDQIDLLFNMSVEEFIQK